MSFLFKGLMDKLEAILAKVEDLGKRQERFEEKRLPKEREWTKKQLAALDHKADIKTLQEEVRRLSKANRSLREQQQFLIKKQEDTRIQLNSLIRQNFLDASTHPSLHRFKLHSQNEEDGLILWLLRKTGIIDGTFVDIGCGRKGGNCGMLAFEFGWRGLMIDAREISIQVMLERHGHRPNLSAKSLFVTKENINDLLDEHDLSEPDVFSLDIDSYDYWVFEALTHRPKIVILEYNALFGRDALTIPEGALEGETPKHYHGASLKALTQLAQKKGYRLLFTDESGINAFYLRQDLCPEIPTLTADEAYRFVPRLTRDGSEESEHGPEHYLASLKQQGVSLQSV